MNNLIKKITLALTAMLLFMTALPPSLPAAADDGYYYYYDGKSEYVDAEKYIAGKLYNFSENIDISKYKLTLTDFEEIMTDILLSRPDIFYVEPEYTYTSYKGSKYIISVRPSYYYAKTTVNRRREKMGSEADKLLAGIDPAWADIKKALYIHDMLATNVEYDESNEIRSAYEALVTKKTTCVSYALAYKYLMDKVGIKCVCVTSTDISHCWNMVRIGGKWYHVDVTGDDMVPDFIGSVSHDYFLMSDSAANSSRLSHRNWSYGYTADSTRYDNMFWKNSEAKIIPASDGNWYYVNSYDGTVNSYNWTSGTSKRLCFTNRNWKSEKSENFYYSFSRLEYAEGKLFYNSADTIYSCDISTGKTATEKTLLLSSPKAIYGLKIENGVLEYELASSPLDYSPEKKTAFSVNENTFLYAPESFRGVLNKTSSGYSVRLTWDKVKDADGYTVYKYTPEGKKAVKITDTTALSCTVSGLSKGKHCYVVAAYKTVGKKKIHGDFSSTVTKIVN